MIHHVSIARTRRNPNRPARSGQQGRLGHAPTAATVQCRLRRVTFSAAQWQIGIVEDLIAHRVVKPYRAGDIVAVAGLFPGEGDNGGILALNQRAGAKISRVFHAQLSVLSTLRHEFAITVWT